MNEKQQKSTWLHDGALSLAILAAGAAVSFVLRRMESGTSALSMLFVLAVFLIARFTAGYLWGIGASVLSVLIVNYIFTYPYFEFNFTLTGYPLAMVVMLAVSVITSALTSKAKNNENIRIEAEREKTRSNLLRAVSHDIRTPLTCILGATSAIMENDDTLTKEVRLSLLGEVKEDAQWLIRMVENLLVITRIDGDTPTKLVKKPEAAEEVAADTAAKFKKRFPEYGVHVEVPNELLLVPMDAVLVGQVLMNLLENAALHAGSQEPFLLCVRRVQREAEFTVRDYGAGIDPAVLPHIFDGRLLGGGGAQSDGKRNMGIGLSVCSTIVQAHGGHITAQNAQDGGAEFRFYLPLEEESNGK